MTTSSFLAIKSLVGRYVPPNRFCHPLLAPLVARGTGNSLHYDQAMCSVTGLVHDLHILIESSPPRMLRGLETLRPKSEPPPTTGWGILWVASLGVRTDVCHFDVLQSRHTETSTSFHQFRWGGRSICRIRCRLPEAAALAFKRIRVRPLQAHPLLCWGWMLTEDMHHL